jgi:chaperonin GroEL
MKTIAANSGVSGDIVLSDISRSKKTGWGYNAKTKEYCDLFKTGILDSAKVLRVALENAVSTASMILLIDCTITDEPSDGDEKSPNDIS